MKADWTEMLLWQVPHVEAMWDKEVLLYSFDPLQHEHLKKEWDLAWNTWKSSDLFANCVQVSSPCYSRDVDNPEGAWGQGATTMMKGLEYFSFEERLRAGTALPREEEAQGRSYLYLSIPEGSMQRGQSQTFTGAQCRDKRQWSQTETQDVLFKHQEMLLYYAGDRALARKPYLNSDPTSDTVIPRIHKDPVLKI